MQNILCLKKNHVLLQLFCTKHMNSQLRGVVNGIISGVSFGMIPLFSIPVIAAGMDNVSILVYRFLFGSVAMLAILLLRKTNMRQNCCVSCCLPSSILPQPSQHLNVTSICRRVLQRLWFIPTPSGVHSSDWHFSVISSPSNSPLVFC